MPVSRPTMGGAVLAILMGLGLCSTSEAAPLVFNFEGLATGTVVSGTDPFGSQVPDSTTYPFKLSVVAVNAANSLAIFNTALPTGGDIDLGTPNRDFGGPGVGDGGRAGMPGENKIAQGKVLIIPQNLVDINNDGLIDQPNDNQAGGVIDLKFPTKGLFHSLRFVDIEEFGFAIDLYDGNQLVQSFPIPAFGDNSQVLVNTMTNSLVNRAVITFASSGALSEIKFEPLGCLPPACVINGPITACINSLLNFTTTAEAGLSLAWSTAGPCTTEGATNGSNVNVRFTGAGACTVSLTVVDPINPNACTTVCHYFVSASAPPCNISGDLTACVGSIKTYETTVGDNFIRQWSVASSPDGICRVAVPNKGEQILSGGPADQGPSLDLEFLAAGTCTLTLTVTDPNNLGCVATCTRIVTVNNLPPCDITGDQNVCVGNTKTYETSVGSEFTREWSVTSDPAGICRVPALPQGPPPAGQGSLFTVEFIGAGTCTLTLTVRDPNDPQRCVSTCTRVVTVSEPPPCNIDGVRTACVNDTKTYTTTVTGHTLKWSATSTPAGICAINGSDSGSSVDIDFTGAGSCTLSLTVTNPNDPDDCKTVCTFPVIVNPLPDCSFTGAATACVGNTRTYQATAGNLSSYDWSVISTPGSICEIVGGNTGSSVDVKFTGAGQCTLSLKVREGSDAAGCESTCTKIVTVTSQPPCTITGDQAQCTGETASYSVSADGFSKSWSVTSTPDGICETVGSLTGSSVDVKFTGAGQCTVSVLVYDPSDRENCQSSCSTIVTVNQAPVCSIDTHSGKACAGSTVSYSTPSAGSLLWSATSTPAGICAIPGSRTGSSVSVQFTGAGTCTLSLTVTDPQNPGTCNSSTCTTIISVSDISACTISGETEPCIGDSETYSATIADGLTKLWSVTSTPAGICTTSGDVSGSSVNVGFTGAGSCTISLTVSDPQDPTNCRKTCSLIVNSRDCSEPEEASCWVTGGGCFKSGSTKLHNFSGNVGPQPSGNWHHTYSGPTPVEFHSYDATSDRCWQDDGEGPCSPAAQYNNIEFSGTGRYRIGRGAVLRGTFRAHIQDRGESGHGPGACGGKDTYEIWIYDANGAEILHTSGELDCGNLQIHKETSSGKKPVSGPSPSDFQTDMTPVTMAPASPNPFQQETSIVYSVSGETGREVSVSVYDVSGRQVRQLSQGFEGPGEHETSWDGRTDGGDMVTGGIYFIRVSSGNSQAITRVMFVR